MIRILVKRKVIVTLVTVVILTWLGLQNLWDYTPQTPHLRAITDSNENPDLQGSSHINVSDHQRETISTKPHKTAPPLQPEDLVRLSSMIMMPSPSVPGLYNYLPHIAANPDLLLPEMRLSNGRTDVSIVIGIPSIRRPVDIYVYDTLRSLFDGMSEKEKEDVLIILCITEPWNTTYESLVFEELKVRFPGELSQGLLDVITPKAGYYPDFSQLKSTLGDKLDRVKWRSKQNLDYAYLMLHAWNRGKYYVQLEDDIEAVPGYITSMKEAIAKNYGDWFALEFSTLGFIGRLFHSQDVPSILEFLLMFYSRQPCDWLYDEYLRVKMCGHGENWSKCIHKIRSIARSVKPSLFQHKGYRSSLKGTVNKLKDKHFSSNESNLSFNPPVLSIITTLKTYSKYDIYNAYAGNDIFWGSSPREGDVLDFLFEAPLPLSKVLIETGDKDHADDIFQSTTLEVLLAHMPLSSSEVYQRKIPPKPTDQDKFAYEQRITENPELKKLSTNNTFFHLGEFDKYGKADLTIPKEFGNIWVLRLHTHSNCSNWVIIRKIAFEVR